MLKESQAIHSNLADMEPSRVQFLERTFAEWLGIAGRGSHVAALEEDGVAMLQWLHDLIFIEGRTVDAVRNELFEANGALRFIAISSGKGGVGKTTCSVNLAHAMAAAGHRVLLVDADLGLGNVHVFAGVNPKVTLQDFLHHELAIQDALTPVNENLWLLCGGSGVASLASLDGRRLNRLFRHLRGLKGSLDYVLMDTGAGLSSQVLNFLAQAQDIIVVSTPNIAATLDAYGLIKTIHEGGMNGKVRLLINQCKDAGEAAAVGEKLQDCARQFLGTTPELLGFITESEHVEQSNQARQPFVMQPSHSDNSARINAMATRLATSRNELQSA